MNAGFLRLLPDIYIGAISYAGRSKPFWVCKHKHGSEAEARGCAEYHARRLDEIQSARKRWASDGECAHTSIKASGEEAGVCEVCGQVFVRRGIGVWEPVPLEQAR